MGISQLNIDRVKVRLAACADEISAAQHLRYKVFYEEYKARPSEEMARARRDFDSYDEITDHLIVIDESIADPQQRIVGTYRLLRREKLAKDQCFYTSGEYNIAPLLNCQTTLLELGRSCVLAEYRTRPVLQLLWQGITDYMLDYNIGLMFGCASLHGTDIPTLAGPLSYLYHHHLAPENLRPRALESRYVDMNIIPEDQLDARTVFNQLPPLVKGYLRLGATIGDGAVIDEQFDTVDVCIVLEMQQVANRYKKFYGRKVNRDIPVSEDREKIIA
jgi:L-ornithine Nalpha-acyltransferase